MSSPPALEISGLTKRYRKLVAVDDLSLTIPGGEFVGFIGPNGAGKSSTMSCIAGVIAPDEGSVSISGVDVVQDPVAARRRLGYVPQHLSLLDYLTGEEYLHFIADLRELDAAQRDEETEELLTLTELTDARDTILKEYSGGMVRKLAIAAAIIGGPAVLVLDESFVGLDPESTYRIRKRLRRHCDDGGSILLSSHILDMLEPLCDRFVVIHQGGLVSDLTAAELKDLKSSGDVDSLTEHYLAVTGKATGAEDRERQEKEEAADSEAAASS